MLWWPRPLVRKHGCTAVVWILLGVYTVQNPVRKFDVVTARGIEATSKVYGSQPCLYISDTWGTLNTYTFTIPYLQF